MQRLLATKVALIGLLIAVFLIGFVFIRAIVQERQGSYQTVLRDIATSNVDAQSLFGPLIVVPVTESLLCPDQDGNTRPCQVKRELVISPQHSRWQQQVRVSNNQFKRGIYRAITYANTLNIDGDFVLDNAAALLAENQQADWSKAQMRFYLTDLRGLQSQPVLEIGGDKRVFAFPGDEGRNPLATGYSALNLPAGWMERKGEQPFHLSVTLNGMGRLQVIPAGAQMEVTMRADWPHPAFYGGSLPEKSFHGKGFEAHWQNAFLTNRNNQWLNACLLRNDEAACVSLKQLLQPELQPGLGADSALNLKGGFAVNFIEPVNVYLMTDRAMKYAMLFLVITFGAFFLFEVLRDLRIHPLQYALVGTALAVFYLLLLSFSEHTAFVYAYAGSSGACILLITYYVSHVLKGKRRALGFSALLAGMYATLYVILQSEDYTLMLGSVLVFVLLATVMVLTRRVDWYGATDKSTASGTS